MEEDTHGGAPPLQWLQCLGFGSILSCMLQLFAEIRSNLIVPHSSVPLVAHSIPTAVPHRTSCWAPSLCLPEARLQIFFNFWISHSHSIFHKDLHSTQLSHTSSLYLLGLRASSSGQTWSNKGGLSRGCPCSLLVAPVPSCCVQAAHKRTQQRLKPALEAGN